MKPRYRNHLQTVVAAALAACLAFSPAAQAQTLDELVKQAIAARDARDHAQAVGYFEKALAFMEQGLGRDHADLVPILDSLGAAHRELKQYPQALANFQRSLQIDEKTLGPNDASIAADLRNVAGIHRSMNQNALAVPLYERAVAILEKQPKPDYNAIAVVQNITGLTLAEMRDFPRALASHQRALANYEKVHGAEHEQLVTPLNLLGNLLRDMRDDARAVPYYERSLTLQRKSKGEENMLFAVTANNLAIAYQQSGEFAKALPWYQKSVAIREKLLGPEHASVATALANLATLQRELGDYGQAMASTQRSLAIREKLLGPDHAEVATSLNNLAGLTRAMGDSARALPLYERSLAIREKTFGPVHQEVATSLNNIALLHGNSGDYAKALALYQRSLAIREKVLGPEHPEVATSLSNLGSLYWHLRELDKTAPLMERALAIRVKRLGPEHPDSINSLSNLAVVYRDMGNLEKARPYYERSVELMEKTRGPDHPFVATSLNNLAVFYESIGERAKAIPLHQRSLAIREKSVGPDHRDVAGSLFNLATLLGSAGDKTRPVPMLMRALSIASNANAPEVVWPTQNALRKALARQQQPDLAIFFGKEAVNTIQGLRARLTELDSGLQKSFLADKADVYRGLADLLFEQGRLPEGQQVLLMLKEEEFFDFIRRDGKQDARTTEMAFNASEEPWRKRYGEISNQLGSLGTELGELDRKARSGLSEAESARREQLRGDRKVAQQAFDAFLGDFMRELGGASAQRNRDVGERGLSNLRSLQGTLGSLGNNVVAVHYLVGEERLRILVTTPSIQVARTAAVSSKDLNQKIAFLQSQLQDPRLNPLPMAQELYKLLIAPIAEDLKQAKAQTLMVSLDGTLRYIPLAALHDGKAFVVEQFRLAIFTEAAKDKLKDAPLTTWRVAALGLTAAKPGFSALPSVKGELEGILKSGTHAGMPGEMHLDEAFTSRRMRDVLDKAYPVLHVASHFKFQPGTEANSFLLLGDGNRLTLKDIKEDDYRFNDVDLMTLSACETAVGGGKDANGMEIEGLGALVQKQGAKAVIATLWPVADESTGILMQRFYQVRESGKLTKAEALRQAQIEFIQGKHTPGAAAAERGLTTPNAPKPASSYTHPYYWAPFILMGNWL